MPDEARTEAVGELMDIIRSIAIRKLDLPPEKFNSFTPSEIDRLLENATFAWWDKYFVATRRCHACPVPAR